MILRFYDSPLLLKASLTTAMRISPGLDLSSALELSAALQQKGEFGDEVAGVPS